MKKNSLEKILHVLETGENEVQITEELRESSLKTLDSMLSLAK